MTAAPTPDATVEWHGANQWKYTVVSPDARLTTFGLTGGIRSNAVKAMEAAADVLAPFGPVRWEPDGPHDFVGFAPPRQAWRAYTPPRPHRTPPPAHTYRTGAKTTPADHVRDVVAHTPAPAPKRVDTPEKAEWPEGTGPVNVYVAITKLARELATAPGTWTPENGPTPGPLHPVRWPEHIDATNPDALARIIEAALNRCDRDRKTARKMLGIGQTTWDMYYGHGRRTGIIPK